MLAVQSEKPSKEDGERPAGSLAAFVKVSVDGAPYLRKIDLKMYRSYQELSMALQKMFSSFTSGMYVWILSFPFRLSHNLYASELDI